MKKDFEALKQAVLPVLQDSGVSRSFVFGSYARDEAHEGSDLDLLLSFHERQSLLDLVALKNKLEDVLGISVDIVTEQSLHPKLRPLVDRKSTRTMMIKDPSILIGHILESIDLIDQYASDLTEEDFLSDIGTQDKVIRRLSVIGEAAAQLPESTHLEYPHVKWKEIIGMRNFLIHEYFGVTLSEVWLTIKRDLPELRQQLESGRGISQ